jgi:hypothetical protein
MKKITIAGTEYDVDCNALTYLDYKNQFGEGILDAVQLVQEYLVAQYTAEQSARNMNIPEDQRAEFIGETMRDRVDDFILTITKLAWIFIHTANKNIKDYREWMESIPAFKISEDWIIEVTEYAVDCFQRQGVK